MGNYDEVELLKPQQLKSLNHTDILFLSRTKSLYGVRQKAPETTEILVDILTMSNVNIVMIMILTGDLFHESLH